MLPNAHVYNLGGNWVADSARDILRSKSGKPVVPKATTGCANQTCPGAAISEIVRGAINFLKSRGVLFFSQISRWVIGDVVLSIYLIVLFSLTTEFIFGSFLFKTVLMYLGSIVTVSSKYGCKHSISTFRSSYP